MIFFDSWGTAWTECAADHPQAQNLGPSGTARLVYRAELADRGIDVPYGRTAWGAAFDAGRILLAGEAHEWDTLT